MRQDLPEILPHQRVELARRGKARGALLGPTGAERGHLAIADVVRIARTGAATGAGLVTVAAAVAADTSGWCCGARPVAGSERVWPAPGRIVPGSRAEEWWRRECRR